MQDGEKGYQGLTSEEVKTRVAAGLVNISDNHISKTTSEIIRSHTLTYFNFLNLFLAVLVLLSGQIKNLTFLGVILCNSVIGIVQELKVKKLTSTVNFFTFISSVESVCEGKRQQP